MNTTTLDGGGVKMGCSSLSSVSVIIILAVFFAMVVKLPVSQLLPVVFSAYFILFLGLLLLPHPTLLTRISTTERPSDRLMAKLLFKNPSWYASNNEAKRHRSTLPPSARPSIKSAVVVVILEKWLRKNFKKWDV